VGQKISSRFIRKIRKLFDYSQPGGYTTLAVDGHAIPLTTMNNAEDRESVKEESDEIELPLPTLLSSTGSLKPNTSAYKTQVTL
jgi:hypothetical protein